MITGQDHQDYFHLASEFIQNTSKHVFLTGKAGTGKTTLLKHLREKCKKQLVVVAPTGVAAINAGGATMHSFFQLPFGCFIPGSFRGHAHTGYSATDPHHLLGNLRMSNQKIELIRNLDLVIIDEISMVRCDMLDAVNTVLQHVRKSREPFGGVQMLYIGDLYQLPPVTQDREWGLLKEYYTSPFFFDALVLKESKPICIELKKIYRQSDEHFIGLLNRVRNNEVTEEDFDQLKKLYNPGFKPCPDEHYITLTTHNNKADEINSRELKRLPGQEIFIEATIAQDFPERIFPAEKLLRVKRGAQIMFIKNDTKEKKYFNGKIGIIEEVSHDKNDEFIRVNFPETNETISVKKEIWRNIRYTFNESANRIEEEELGSFTQYPVRLAWAVTIHKSQGLTFKKAVIDAGNAFAAGQVYVALSRCVSPDGIVLLSLITREAITTDERIIEFTNDQHGSDQLQHILAMEKEIYVLKTTIALFGVQPALEKIRSFIEYMGERKLDEKEKIISGLRMVLDELLKLYEVSQKFQLQLQSMSANGFNDAVQQQFEERVLKAKKYFEKELDEKVLLQLYHVNNELQQRKKVRKVLKSMKELMDYFDHFILRYNPERKKQLEQLNQPRRLSPHEGFSGSESGESGQLLKLLKDVRRQYALKENLAPYKVAHDSTLREMATYLPQTMNEMAIIKGMGNHTLDKYGAPFLTIIQSFCETHGLSGKMNLKEAENRQAKIEKKNNPSADSDSKTQSFKLFQSGKTISEIAELRNFSAGTIEAHLACFVKSGELDVNRLLSKEKFDLIADALQKVSAPGLTAVINFLGNAVTYSDVRFVIAAQNQDPRQSATP